jgi:hypothetical protein
MLNILGKKDYGGGGGRARVTKQSKLNGAKGPPRRF